MGRALACEMHMRKPVIAASILLLVVVGANEARYQRCNEDARVVPYVTSTFNGKPDRTSEERLRQRIRDTYGSCSRLPW